MATSNLSRRMIYKRGYDCIQTCFEFHFQSSDAKEGKSKKGRYEDLDMDLAKILERDVLNSNPVVDWDHISGLSHAKRLLFEAIVLPVLQLALFQVIIYILLLVLYYQLKLAAVKQLKDVYLFIALTSFTSSQRWEGFGITSIPFKCSSMKIIQHYSRNVALMLAS